MVLYRRLPHHHPSGPKATCMVVVVLVLVVMVATVAGRTAVIGTLGK